MRLLDAICRPAGYVVLRVFRDGRLVERVCERNLWVEGGSHTVAQLVGGATASNSVTQIGFGTNATSPAATDTALTGAYERAIGAVTYPASNQVSFAFSLGGAEANGMMISEFGLLTAAGALVARKTRSSPIIKSAAVTISGSWIIAF